MSDKQSGLTITHMIVGIVFTVLTSVGGAYVSLREGDVERTIRLDNIEMRIKKVEEDQKETDSRYLEILQKLTEIQVKLEGKKDRE